MSPRGGPYTFLIGQNTFETIITRPDEPLRFSLTMLDLDHDTWELDSRAPFCIVEGNIPPQSIANWRSFNRTYPLTDTADHQDYAPCRVTVRVTGGPAR